MTNYDELKVEMRALYEPNERGHNYEVHFPDYNKKTGEFTAVYCSFEKLYPAECMRSTAEKALAKNIEHAKARQMTDKKIDPAAKIVYN